MPVTKLQLCVHVCKLWMHDYNNCCIDINTRIMWIKFTYKKMVLTWFFVVSIGRDKSSEGKELKVWVIF